jgi:hypothetical protein
MVEEMNRYQESPTEVLDFLNVQPMFEDDARFKATLFDKKGKVQDLKSSGDEEWHGNPLKDEIHFYFESHGKKKRFLAKNDLSEVNETTGAYIFVNKRGYRLVLKRWITGPMANFKALEKLLDNNKDLRKGQTVIDMTTSTNDESSVSSEEDSYKNNKAEDIGSMKPKEEPEDDGSTKPEDKPEAEGSTQAG